MQEFTQLIVDWLQSVFNNPYITTALISIVPMIEVRGAITVGTALELNPWIAYVLSCCSALLVCPVLLLCLKPILNWLKRTKAFKNIAAAVEETFVKKARKIEEDAKDKDVTTADKEAKAKKSRLNKTLGIFLFVAIPLPMTGVWTGTAVAAFLNLEYRYSVPAIVAGNFVAGLIITLLNIVLGEYASLILLVLGLFVLASLASLVITFVVRYNKIKKQKAIAKGEKEESVEE